MMPPAQPAWPELQNSPFVNPPLITVVQAMGTVLAAARARPRPQIELAPARWAVSVSAPEPVPLQATFADTVRVTLAAMTSVPLPPPMSVAKLLKVTLL